MKNRTIVRSLTTSEGTLVAMDDGLIVWNPTNDRPIRQRLETLPTVLLAIRGPMGRIDTAVVGNTMGEEIVLTLPRLEVVQRFVVKGGSIRAVSLVNDASMKLLAGTQNGEVWCLDEQGDVREHLLFSIDGPVSSLHCDSGIVHVRSAWIHHMHAWDGTVMSSEDTASTYSQLSYKRLDRTYAQRELPTMV